MIRRRDRRRPIDDPEILELFANEPELLAVTDAIHASYPLRQRGHRALLAAAAVVVTVLAAFVVWPGDGPSVVESALAAVGNQPVIHSVVHRPAPDAAVVDIASGRESAGRVELEFFFDVASRRLRTVTRRNGILVADVVEERPTSTEASVTALAEQPKRLTVSYREALERGAARAVDRGSLGRLEVIWLEINAAGRRQVVAVDDKDYRAVAFRERTNALQPLWTVETLTSVPRRAADFRARPPARHPISGSVVGKESVPLARVAAAVDWPVVWPGQRVAALRFEAANAHDLERRYADGRRASARGIELIYRGPSGRLIVRQSRQPEPAYRFVEGRLTFNFEPIPPRGMMAITRQSGGVNEWIGQLRATDAFITIVAPSRQLLLAAARQLTAI